MMALRARHFRSAFCSAAVFRDPYLSRAVTRSYCNVRMQVMQQSIGPRWKQHWFNRSPVVLRFQKPPSDSGGGFGNGGSGGGFGRGGWGGNGGGDGGEGGPLGRLLALYVGALASWPVLTKASSTLVLGLAGDYCAQRLTAAQDKEEFSLDVRRLLSVGAWSFCFMGPALHYWYAALDGVFYGRLAALYKLVSDQVFFAPAFNAAFIAGVGALEGTPTHELRENLANRFWPSMKANWMLWPAAQAINFSVVPKTWQILYVNSVGFVWNIILTYIAHSDMASESKEEERAVAR